ncbi:MAG: hypothetical protein KatS3mg111_2411 [Pirellulaceae bacterium]|nr:MAG: hypothetical protein KatS3mg111_2411 [Pirellulaceae bacterium]
MPRIAENKFVIAGIRWMLTIRPPCSWYAPFRSLILTLAVFPITATADIFRFQDGRVVAGKVIRQTQQTVDERAQTVWTVEIEPGVFLQIYESELERNGHEPLSEAEKEYAAKIATLPETAQAHYDLAGWCSQHGLTGLAKAHYQRAVDLDPEHEAARAAAGYKKDENGRWVRKDEIYGERRGKILYKGRWRFPEAVAIEEAEEKAQQELAPLRKDLYRWHSQASTGRSARLQEEALAHIRQINDPRAIGILGEFLLDTKKPAPVPLRMLYVEVLSRFRNPQAAQILASTSLLDPVASVRHAALDALAAYGREWAVPFYIAHLRNPNNELVNRAAECLGQFNPPEAILPLIEALNTEHVQETGGGPNMNVSNQGGLSFGGGPKKVQVTLQNASVHATLAALTEQNYGYDESQWLAWYARTFAPPVADLRRDP